MVTAGAADRWYRERSGRCLPARPRGRQDHRPGDVMAGWGEVRSPGDRRHRVVPVATLTVGLAVVRSGLGRPRGTPGRSPRRRSGRTTRPDRPRRWPAPGSPARPTPGTRAASGGGPRRGRPRPARGKTRRSPRLRPVEVDRVVDVVHRIELLGPDRQLEADRRPRGGWRDPDPDRVEALVGHPEGDAEARRDPGRDARDRRSAPSPRGRSRRARRRVRNSVRRRARTLRAATASVVPTSSSP